MRGAAMTRLEEKPEGTRHGECGHDAFGEKTGENASWGVRP